MSWKINRLVDFFRGHDWITNYREFENKDGTVVIRMRLCRRCALLKLDVDDLTPFIASDPLKALRTFFAGRPTQEQA